MQGHGRTLRMHFFLELAVDHSQTPPPMIPLPNYREYSEDEMRTRAKEFADDMHRRRSVREFSDRPVDAEVIRHCVRAAVSSPSGANRQPWHYVVVTDPGVKREIRLGAEAEEREFYNRRAPEEWLDALAPLGTDAQKPFLEVAPVLIVVFYARYGLGADGQRFKNYYALDSVGLSGGILLSALHRAGLATLTHTPSPMKFLNRILNRPRNESPFMLVVCGYPAEGCEVPDIQRKALSESSTWI